MSAHNIPFSILKRKSSHHFPNLQIWDFSKGLNNEFETAVETSHQCSRRVFSHVLDHFMFNLTFIIASVRAILRVFKII